MISKGLEVLDDTDCMRLLRSKRLGRVGVRIADGLTVLPVYYALMDRDIVFRTSAGTKLDAAVLGTRVVFEVDNASPGWSVLVHGHVHEIRHLDAIARVRALLGDDWPAGERERYVQITCEQLTGRRLRDPGSARA
jgi:nitroimidazol reductase NimA-like FMN-containing flavoprotein (pyridoxamine 5'-phosphate oxidase superfamily)